MTSRKETIQVIKHAIASRDSGLLKAIIAYKPTEYIEIIQNEGLIDLGNLELAALLLEMGIEMGPYTKSDRRKYARNMDGYQIGKLLTEFGFERAKPLLQYIPSEISEPYELVTAFYQDSVEALEWLRDSDIRNLLDDICINEPIFNDPDPAKVAVFFTCPSGSTQKWGRISIKISI